MGRTVLAIIAGCVVSVLVVFAVEALGAWVGSRLSRTGKAWPGLVVGAVTLVATVVNLFTIAHPTWVVGAAVVGIPLATWIGARGGRTPPATMTSARVN